ncbi:MAG TPA: TIGR00645 family protein [Nitrospiraceae bacterium]|nr:TIGR00645 family protein [Nitrospiraceae bacterium]
MSHSEPSEPAAAKHALAPINPIEHAFETVVFASRWIQAPLYGGLIIAELLYAYKFLLELWEMIWHINQQQETTFMLGVLGLIDVTMVANLLTMVIIGGYATFVSKLDLEGHADRPDWLTHIDPGTIKIKLAASLIGISSIHLLKSFVNIAHEDFEQVKWKIFIHLTFIGSAILLAWTDKIMQKDRKH